MRKIDFEVAIKTLGITKRIGTYDSAGERCDIFMWNNYCLYHADGAKAFIAGKFPLPLVYRIYQTLNGNEGFTLESDRKEWKAQNLTPDQHAFFDKDYYEESISKGYNRTYSVTSVEDFFEMIIMMENYRRKRTGFEILSEERIDEYSADTHLTVDAIIKSRVASVPKGRRIKRQNKKDVARQIIGIELSYLDSVINPLQGGRFTLDTYDNYSSKINVSIDEHDDEYVRVTYVPTTGNGLTIYEESADHIIYDSIIIMEENRCKRIRHMSTEYREGDHMSGEVLEVVSGISSKRLIGSESTPTIDFAYNITEHAICEQGTWRPIESADMSLIQETLTEAINLTAEISLANMVAPGYKIDFKPIAS